MLLIWVVPAVYAAAKIKHAFPNIAVRIPIYPCQLGLRATKMIEKMMPTIPRIKQPIRRSQQQQHLLTFKPMFYFFGN